MALQVKFVDEIAAGHGTRLDVNTGKWTFLRDPTPDFSPPPLKRSVADTMLRQGAKVVGSAYENRRLRFSLAVEGTSADDLATELQKLHRELDRAQNILKYQPDGATNPVYFKTWRSPAYRLQAHAEHGPHRLRLGLDLLAEPFAYGEAVSSSGTIYNDPASGTNPCSFQIAATDGDIPTPLEWQVQSGVLANDEILLAVRRHGTPALYFKQAEAMTQRTDTTIQSTDPLMSGASNNWSQTTFATPTMVQRLQEPSFPAGAGAANSLEYRGLYRVFVRVRKTVANDGINIRMDVGPSGSSYQTDPVAVPNTTALQLVDLGLVGVPILPDPIYNGGTGAELPVMNMPLRFQAERTSGSGYLDWDYAIYVPADEELAIADFRDLSQGMTFDGPNDVATSIEPIWAYVRSDADAIPMVGSIPLVTPNQTNLFVLLRGIATNVLADQTAYYARYWPRWLYVRP